MSASLKPLTRREFLEWERGEPERYEFDGVQPVAMTGGSVAHARLVRRLVSALTARLPPGCEAFGGDLKVLTATGVRYPDALVTCGPVEPGADAVEPTVVFEVLSASTALTDRRVKAVEYAEIPSVLAYVLLQQEPARGIVLRRSEGWLETMLVGREKTLTLKEIGIEIPFSDLYD